MPPQGLARERVLTDDEIRRVWLAAGEIGQPLETMVRPLLLTGCWLSEIAELERSQIRKRGRRRRGRATVVMVPGEGLGGSDLRSRAVRHG